MYVARLRYIQSVHETPERRNPDTLVRHFLPPLNRMRAFWIGRSELSNLRSDPFYYYLIARTRYYDQVLQEAVADGARRVICVGCGTDTRAYRFRDLLHHAGVRVLECDQAPAIAAKRRIVARRWPDDRIQYMPIDLNADHWPELAAWLQEESTSKSLVYLEGVSPYIDSKAFELFLSLLSARLSPGSHVAYDFKLAGIADHFGREKSIHPLFRLTDVEHEVASFHESHGFTQQNMEFSSALCSRFMPNLRNLQPAFYEDALVRLSLPRS